jgi:trans-aconitate 2-methyltransferase
MSDTSYAFRDVDLAAERLRLVAEVFRAESQAFLARADRSGLALAIDLGCGPGHTTRLVADTLRPAATVGLDTSVRFLALARDANPDLRFVEHDVTRAPFPTEPADLAFAHLLLTHLPDPAQALTTWASQLRPGGLILCDEVELIYTAQPTFAAYRDIVAALVSQHGGDSYVGATLNRLPDLPGLTRRASDLARVPVRTADAAGMFRRNLEVWRHDPFIRANYAEQILSELAGEFEVLVSSEAHDEIEWGFRQIVFVSSPE